MKNVLVTLSDYLPHSSPTERTIIEYILRSPESAVNETIKQLCANTFSSQATVVRLCTKMGFSGYRDFRQTFRSELEIIRRSKVKKVSPITAGDDLEEIASKVNYSNMKALQDTFDLLDTEILDSCIRLMEKANNIGLFGIGAGLVVARDLHMKMLRINRPCFFSDDWHNQRIQAQNLGPDDLAIVISYSGRTREVVECTQILKKNNCPVIAVTQKKNSPIANLSTYNLYVAADEQEIRNGATASRIAQLNVIDILYSAYSYRVYDSLMQKLVDTYIKKDNS